jgi:hypothetical protein
MAVQDPHHLPQGFPLRPATTGDEGLNRHVVILGDISERLDEYFALPTLGNRE